jgi:hypothetical protein
MKPRTIALVLMALVMFGCHHHHSESSEDQKPEPQMAPAIPPEIAPQANG